MQYSPDSNAATGASSSPWIKKPLSVVYQQEHARADSLHGCGPPSSRTSPDDAQHSLRRHLSVWDLIGIGVGGTVGSGIFVLTGQIASENSGPLTALSFLISGLAACCSGMCYAELSGRIPAAGSTYVYAYVCLGEIAAVISASCLTLEYGIAGAAVARSWGDKVIEWMADFLPAVRLLEFGPGGMVNVPAGLISMGCTILLSMGVQESKRVTNFFTVLKMLIVVFMTIGGFVLMQPKNFKPLAPFGIQGVLRGATSSFFGYLGYDEVCCVAGEAIDPTRTMPRAVLGTLIIVTVCYVLSAVAITGMLPYSQISPTSGFPDAFEQRGWIWASQITAIGELVCLPVVVLVSLMAQPRVALSMAQDGLLPSVFSRLDDQGNLYSGTLLCGIVMAAIAAFVPFQYLNDLISAGILVAFSMTNCCLVLLRCQTPTHAPKQLEVLLVLFNSGCFIAALLWSHDFLFIPFKQTFWAVIATLLTFYCLIYMATTCPKSAHFGGSILPPPRPGQLMHLPDEYFQTPFVPYLPCIGMAINWYL